MSTSTITRKGQVTIPKDIRQALELREGERVLFVQRGDEIVIKVLRGNILDLKGSVKARRRPEDFQKVRSAAKVAVAQRVAKDG